MRFCAPPKGKFTSYEIPGGVHPLPGLLIPYASMPWAKVTAPYCRPKASISFTAICANPVARSSILTHPAPSMAPIRTSINPEGEQSSGVFLGRGFRPGARLCAPSRDGSFTTYRRPGACGHRGLTPNNALGRDLGRLLRPQWRVSRLPDAPRERRASLRSMSPVPAQTPARGPFPTRTQ